MKHMNYGEIIIFNDNKSIIQEIYREIRIIGIIIYIEESIVIGIKKKEK